MQVFQEIFSNYSLVVFISLGIFCVMIALLLALMILRSSSGLQKAFKSSAKDTALVFFTIFFFILLIEITLSLIGFDPWIRSDMQSSGGYYHLVPNGKKADPIHDEGVRLVTKELDGEGYWYFEGEGFNRFGTRGQEPLPKKPDIRILWMGNSTVFGSGVEDEQTFASKSAQILRETIPSKQIESVNLAIPGYSLANAKAALKAQLPNLPADLLVLGLWDGGMYNTKIIDNVLYSAEVEVLDGERFFNVLPFPKKSIVKMVSLSKLFGLGLTAYGVLRIDKTAKAISVTEKILRDLEEIKKLCDSKSINLLMLWLPPLDREFKEQLKNPNPEIGDNIIREVHFAAVNRWASENNVDLKDLRVLLEDYKVKEIRLDRCCHFNKKGHLLVAEKISGWISGKLAEHE